MVEFGIEIRSATPEWTELRLPSTLESVDRVQEYFAAIDADLAPRLRRAVAEALHELLLNAVEWGAKFNPEAQVKVVRVRGAKMLQYCISDPGFGFHAGDLPHAAVSYDDQHRLDHLQVRLNNGMRAGGYGLLLVRELVDELIYNQARNEVIFVVYL